MTANEPEASRMDIVRCLVRPPPRVRSEPKEAGGCQCDGLPAWAEAELSMLCRLTNI